MTHIATIIEHYLCLSLRSIRNLTEHRIYANKLNMSGPSGSLASRPLSTTEELEKLEQSITLTLQGRPARMA